MNDERGKDLVGSPEAAWAAGPGLPATRAVRGDSRSTNADPGEAAGTPQTASAARPSPLAPRPSSLHIVYDVPGWAHHRRAEALTKYAPAGWTVTSGPMNALPADWSQFDVVLLLPYGLARDVRRRLCLLPSAYCPLLICGYNCGVGYRRELFNGLLEQADHVVINNRSNWEACGKHPKTTWISNGVDLDLFCPLSPVPCPLTPAPRVLSLGSSYHRHHNDDLKGLGLLESIRPRLETSGIACDFREIDSVRGPKMTAAELADWYRSGTVYVVASRCEGTPNPALEAAACGCVLVSTRVGNMPELIEDGVNGLLVERTAEGLEAGIRRAVDQGPTLAMAILEAIRGWDWRLRAARYFELFRKLKAES